MSGSAEQFRMLAELGGDVAWIVDCATNLPRYVSPAIEQLLGYGVDEIDKHMGEGAGAAAALKPLAALVPLNPLAMLCAGLPARLARFAGGDLSRLRVVRQFDQPHRDGRLVPIEVVSRLLLDGAGRPDVLVGTVRDLSARRREDDARAAEQRRFVSMLNHEFRTPLSTIDGAVQRLESNSANADAPTRARYRRIAGALEQLIGMLDDYLSPERIARTGATRPAERIDPRQLLIDAATDVGAAGRGVTLDLGDLPARLRCAPEGVRLALKVLVDNALQYGPSDAPIALSGRRDGGGVALLVRDVGAGVPAAEMARIFAKSWRGSNAGARPGSGLGLYMARSVIEVHGGMLDVRNVEPAGAQFRIWLPLREGAGKNIASGGHTSDNSDNIEQY